MRRKLELDLTAAGTGKVVLDGLDVSHVVNGVELRARVSDVTRATLMLSAPELVASLDAEVLTVLRVTPPRRRPGGRGRRVAWAIGSALVWLGERMWSWAIRA